MDCHGHLNGKENDLGIRRLWLGSAKLVPIADDLLEGTGLDEDNVHNNACLRGNQQISLQWDALTRMATENTRERYCAKADFEALANDLPRKARYTNSRLEPSVDFGVLRLASARSRSKSPGFRHPGRALTAEQLYISLVKDELSSLK